MCFAEENKWLVSTWNATLGWIELSSQIVITLLYIRILAIAETSIYIDSRLMVLSKIPKILVWKLQFLNSLNAKLAIE